MRNFELDNNLNLAQTDTVNPMSVNGHFVYLIFYNQSQL